MKVVNASRPAKQRQAADSLIRFIRPGQPARKSYRKAKTPFLLDVASYWSVDFDLSEFRRPGSAYVFPTKNEWKFYAIVIEVGTRGWIPPSVHSGLSRLGIPRHLVKSLCKQLTLLATKSSYIIWLNRFNQDLQPWRLITH